MAIFKKALFLLSIFALGLEASAVASTTHCLVVSGVNRDHNNSFEQIKDRVNENKLQLLGRECKVFSSWARLKVYFDSVKESLPAEKNQFFIQQLAHGGVGGSCVGDDSNEGGAQIFETLLDMSQTHKIALHSGSCYSGDLLPRLIDGQINAQDEKSRDVYSRLCIATDSVQGYVASHLKLDSRRFELDSIERTDSMESAFSRFRASHHRFDSLISSAVYRFSDRDVYTGPVLESYYAHALKGLRDRIQVNNPPAEHIKLLEEAGKGVAAKYLEPNALGPSRRLLQILTLSWAPRFQAASNGWSFQTHPSEFFEIHGKTFADRSYSGHTDTALVHFHKSNEYARLSLPHIFKSIESGFGGTLSRAVEETIHDDALQLVQKMAEDGLTEHYSTDAMNFTETDPGRLTELDLQRQKACREFVFE